MSIPNSDPFENEEEEALASDNVYWAGTVNSLPTSPSRAAASQEVYVPIASTSKVTLEDLGSPSPEQQLPIVDEDMEADLEDDDLPPPLSFSRLQSVLAPDDQLPTQMSPVRPEDIMDEALDVDMLISPARSQYDNAAPTFSIPTSPLSLPSLSQLHNHGRTITAPGTSAKSPEPSPAAHGRSKPMSSPDSLPSLSQIHPVNAPRAPRSPSEHQQPNIETSTSKAASPVLDRAPRPSIDAQPAPDEGYKRSLRHRAPKQLMPYSIEQAGYINALNRNQWEDAVVKVRTADWTAEELAARRAQQLANGQDDLEGWLELEGGMVRRLEDPDQLPPVAGGEIASVKRKRSSAAIKESEKKMALRRALGGRTDGESSEADTSIPTERSTPRQKRRKPMQSASTSRQPRVHANRERSSNDGQFNENRSRLATIPRLDRKTSSAKEYTSITLSGSSATSTSGSDNADENGMSGDLDASRSHTVERVMPERFKLEGKRKKHLRGMMPGSFLKKAESDLRLMAQERKQGQRRPELFEIGSGDEQAEDGPDRYRTTTKRKRPTKASGNIHDVETLTVESSASASATEEDIVIGRPAIRAREVAETDSEQEEMQVVASWLVGDLPNHAGKRSRGSDLIDRLLARSRQQPVQRNKSKSKNVARRKKVRRIDEVVGSEEVAELQTTSPKFSTHRLRRPGTSLADDSALFVGHHVRPDQASQTEQEPERTSESAAMPIPPVDIDLARRNRPPADLTSPWLQFNQFSYDFDLVQLPAGTTVASNSPIRNGDAAELIRFLKSTGAIAQAQPAIAPYGILLDWNIDPATFISLLPRIFDQYRQSIGVDAPDAAFFSALESLVSLLEFSANYVTKQFDEATANHNIWTLLHEQIRQTDQFVSFSGAPESTRRRLLRASLAIHWCVTKILLRLCKQAILAGTDVGKFPPPSESIQRLVQDLIAYGPNETGRSVRSAARSSTFGAAVDYSVEIWINLLLLVLDKEVSSEAAFTIPLPEAFWKLSLEELDRSRLAHPSHHAVVDIESACYLAMLLSCLSQMSITGVTAAKPQLPCHWPVVTRALELLKLSQQQGSAPLSKVETARRDGYLWTILARVLTLNRRWGWRLDSKDGISTKLYDLLNHNCLANLALDRSDEFPNFLQHFTGELPRDLSADDTSFTILLKILHAQVQDLPSNNLPDRTKLIARMLARLTPMRKLPFTENDCVLDSDRSVLVHHYSLFMTYTVFSPSTSGQRFAQLRSLLRFEDADHLSKSVQIRAMMHLAKIHRQLGIAVQPLVDWLASACDHLATQFEAQSKRRSSIMNAPGKTAAKGGSVIRMTAEEQREVSTINTASGRLAISFTMILRAVQNILLAKPLSAPPDSSLYPDLALLHPSWTSAPLNSGFARDPMIGTEVLKCLQCFLNLRTVAIGPKIQAESFDEFGLDDFDFNDPTLNDMIGFQAHEDSEALMRNQDKALAQLIKEHYSPAIYKLLSSIYTADLPQKGAPPAVNAATERHVDYTAQLVSCWVACANVLVENDIRNWATYFNFGDESFRRIPDPVGRREVSVFFALELSKIDVGAFKANLNEMVGIWFDTVMLRTISVQHLLTGALLNALPSDDALMGNVLIGRESDDDSYVFPLASWQEDRLRVLDAVFDNMNNVLSGGSAPGQRSATSSTIFSLLNTLASSMRDNLDACASQDGQAKAGYTAVCIELYRRLKARAGPQVNERSVPNLRLIAGLV